MKTSVRRQIPFYVAVVTILIGFHSCQRGDNPVEPVPGARGEIAVARTLSTMTTSAVQQALASSNVQIPFTLTYSVETLSIQYSTIDGNGNAVLASGALMIPQSAQNLPLISIQHGTESKSNLVASVSPFNSVEGMVGLMAASMGYLVVVPDYPGFGKSTVMHPYLHARSLVPSVIDFMRAGRSYSSSKGIILDGRVFLTGYSEGGYVSLAAQKAIEEQHSAEFQLTAVAPISGPYDLVGMVHTIFQTNSYSSPAYIAFFLTAYDNIYGWNRLDDYFNAPYASRMAGLFNGSKTWGEIVQQLPPTFSALVKSSFASDFLGGKEEALLTAIQANTLLDWEPNAPVHFFHGDADNIVPLANAHTAMDRFVLNGATDIQLTTIPGGTHESSGGPAIIGAFQWFETF